jgi:hypothetical protein
LIEVGNYFPLRALLQLVWTFDYFKVIEDTVT